MRGVLGLGLLMLFLAATPAHAQNAKFLQKFSDWSAYVHASAAKKVCFVIAQPKEKLPKRVRRGPIYFYISHWPNEKVRNEIRSGSGGGGYNSPLMMRSSGSSTRAPVAIRSTKAPVLANTSSA